MSHVVIRAGEAGNEKVAQGLLRTAGELGLPLDVVVWSPSLGGFKVPEAVAAAYAGAEDPDAQPETADADDVGLVAEPVPPQLSPWQAEGAGPRRYSDEEKAAAVAAVNSGLSVAVVAEQTGASATSVSNWVTAAKKAAEAEGASNG